MQGTFINYVNNMSMNNQSQKLQDLIKQDTTTLETVMDEDALITDFKEAKEYITEL